MRKQILGCPVDILSKVETVDLAREAMLKRITIRHVALNVAKLVNMRFDPVLACDVLASDIVGIDGMGIVFAARALGIPVAERVAGIDLFLALMSVCGAEGFRPFLLGATDQVVHQAVATLELAHPSISFAGVRDGYFTSEQELEVVKSIRDSGADCLFIGMPTPRKERFLAAHKDALNVPFVMGVGGTFDVVAGKISRAPARVQAFGLEWLFRVYQEPQRMWWRYSKTNTVFAALLFAEIVSRAIFRRSNDEYVASK